MSTSPLAELAADLAADPVASPAADVAADLAARPAARPADRAAARARKRIIVALVTATALILALDARSPVEAATKKRAKKTVAKTTTTAARSTSTAPSTAPSTSLATTTTSPPPQTWVVSVPESGHATFVRNVIADLESFWSSEYPKNYGRPLPGGLSLHGATPDSPPPSCVRRSGTASYRTIVDNAYYCPARDVVAWDDVSLFGDLLNRSGEIALGIVLAHEVGHAVQARARVIGSGVSLELQADCFAGAWTARVARGEARGIALGPEGLDRTVGAMLRFRDRPGVSSSSQNAHGNGFDRVNSFQLGYEGGVRRCASYETDPPRPTGTSFRSVSELQSGGDVALEEAVTFAQKSLDRFYGEIPGFVVGTQVVLSSDLAAAQNACPTGTPIASDWALACPGGVGLVPALTLADRRTRQVHSEIGDFGVATIMGWGWAAMAQRSVLPGNGRFPNSNLHADCLTGAWISAAARSTDPALSPGDLDEAIITMLSAPGSIGTFERVRAMRTGFAGGLGSCAA